MRFPPTDIQLIQAPETWAAERASWRIVIQLNLVRAVNTILDILSTELNSPDPLSASLSRADSFSALSNSPARVRTRTRSTGHAHTFSRPGALDISSVLDIGMDDPPSPSSGSSPSSPSSPSVRPTLSLDAPLALSPTTSSSPSLALTPAHSSLYLRLTPLRQVEADLKLLLGAPSEEITEGSLNCDHSAMVATPFEAGAYPLEVLAGSAAAPVHRPREFYVRSHKSWRENLSGGLGGEGRLGRGVVMSRNGDARSIASGAGRGGADADATEVIAGCREDIAALWEDHVVDEILVRRKISLGDSAE